MPIINKTNAHNNKAETKLSSFWGAAHCAPDFSDAATVDKGAYRRRSPNQAQCSQSALVAPPGITHRAQRALQAMANYPESRHFAQAVSQQTLLQISAQSAGCERTTGCGTQKIRAPSHTPAQRSETGRKRVSEQETSGAPCVTETPNRRQPPDEQRQDEMYLRSMQVQPKVRYQGPAQPQLTMEEAPESTHSLSRVTRQNPTCRLQKMYQYHSLLVVRSDEGKLLDGCHDKCCMTDNVPLPVLPNQRCSSATVSPRL